MAEVESKTPVREGYKQTEIGEIPESWEVRSIGSLALVTDFVANGSFASLKENVTYLKGSGFAVLVRTADFSSGWNGNYVWVDEHAYRFLAKSSLLPGDLVICNVGAVGTVFCVPDLDVPMTIGPNAVLCRTSNPELLSQRFFAQVFHSRVGKEKLKAITTQTAQAKFNKTDFRGVHISLPPLPEQQAIAEVLESVDDSIRAEEERLTQLETLKRGLMQDLLTGKVRVKVS
jgi:type I restriction enzyme, S subunit